MSKYERLRGSVGVRAAWEGVGSDCLMVEGGKNALSRSREHRGNQGCR